MKLARAVLYHSFPRTLSYKSIHRTTPYTLLRYKYGATNVLDSRFLHEFVLTCLRSKYHSP